jgi:prepilin-type N-terminal cleavage/methylation domain-containing protein
MKMYGLSHRNKAFTLVELMITIGIIGILLAIASVGILKARESARRDSCQANQTKIDAGVVNYILDNNVSQLNQLPFAGNVITDPSASVIFGPENYVKFVPRCPARGTYFFLETEGLLGESVRCTLAGIAPYLHDYPPD